LKYDNQSNDALLDIYRPANKKISFKKLPIVVWIHGGGLISGSKDQVSNYCKIIAGSGYIVAAIDYTIAPEAKYPTPVIQTQKALKYLIENAAKFGIDTSAFFLAGDSGGSMIAAASAAVISNPDYGNVTRIKPGLNLNNLRGLILFCGIYDVNELNLDGTFGSFMRTVLWSYFGKKDISNDAYARAASVIHYINNRFPKAFISAGNNDPLLPQSTKLAEKMRAEGIESDTLFFDANRTPGLGHEYQFALETAEGKQALLRCLNFLSMASN